MPLRKKTLKVVPAPLVETVPTAPPALEAPNPTVECKCGNCGAVLMRGDRSKTGPLDGSLPFLRRLQFDGRLIHSTLVTPSAVACAGADVTRRPSRLVSTLPHPLATHLRAFGCLANCRPEGDDSRSC